MQPAISPTISFKALQRARTTIEDFVCSYFPYHSLPIPQALFSYLDVLVFIEATIYQMDELNESLAAAGALAPEHKFPEEIILLNVLADNGWLDDRIHQELQEGLRYWKHERELSSMMLERGDSLRHGTSKFSSEDILQAHLLKSFDYRLLHLVLHKLIRSPYDEALLQFLKVDELLVDIGDDLTDYEDDVLANSFNIYRGFIHCYGDDAEIKLVEYISQLEQQHLQLLMGLPAVTRQIYELRHKEASAVAGSEKWVFPRPIYDEQAYRQQFQD